MPWSHRHARFTLLLFFLIFAAGQLKIYLSRPVYPDLNLNQEIWPPDGHLLDVTVLKNQALAIFPRGTTISKGISELGLRPDQNGSGFCLPRAGVLYRAPAGWRTRPMTQRERWVWRIPMDLYQCEPVDLSRISGIGPSLALKIFQFVQGRGYLDSISDLDEVPGVGAGKLSALRKELALN